MNALERLLSDAATKNMKIKGVGYPDYEIRRTGSDRPVVIYTKSGNTFDWAFQVPAPKGPTPKTLRTLKAVRQALGL